MKSALPSRIIARARTQGTRWIWILMPRRASILATRIDIDPGHRFLLPRDAERGPIVSDQSVFGHGRTGMPPAREQGQQGCENGRKAASDGGHEKTQVGGFEMLTIVSYSSLGE